MQGKKPDVSAIDDFINQAPMKPSSEEKAIAPASAVPADEKSPAGADPRPSKTTLPRKSTKDPQEADPLVHLNVPIPLSLRDWLNIRAIQDRTNLTQTLIMILEKSRADWQKSQ